MRIILVTSTVTYLRDNYLGLFRYLLKPGNLPPGVELVAGVFLRTHGPGLLLRGLGLMAAGVRDIGGALIKNSIRHLTGDPRSDLFRACKIPFIIGDSINSKKLRREIAGLKPDLLVNLRTRQIYRKGILSVPSLGCINLHHGLLPQQRGTFCDLWAWAGGKPVGFSIHWMNRRVDDGRIILTGQVPVDGVKSYGEIPMLSADLEGPAIVRALEIIRDGGAGVGVENSDVGAVFYKTPGPGEIRDLLKKGLKL